MPLDEQLAYISSGQFMEDSRLSTINATKHGLITGVADQLGLTTDDPRFESVRTDYIELLDDTVERFDINLLEIGENREDLSRLARLSEAFIAGVAGAWNNKANT